MCEDVCLHDLCLVGDGNLICLAVSHLLCEHLNYILKIISINLCNIQIVPISQRCVLHSIKFKREEQTSVSDI